MFGCWGCREEKWQPVKQCHSLMTVLFGTGSNVWVTEDPGHFLTEVRTHQQYWLPFLFQADMLARVIASASGKQVASLCQSSLCYPGGGGPSGYEESWPRTYLFQICFNHVLHMVSVPPHFGRGLVERPSSECICIASPLTRASNWVPS